MNLLNKNILLIITGGISAYKSLELIRLLKKQGADVKCVLTKGGAEFITPLSVASLSENPVYTDLFNLKDETEMGHIRLSREADLIIIAPATANIIAKMAVGMADDLASTILLASNKPVMIAPAMNPMMWQNPATTCNVDILQQRGFKFIEPETGIMACGEEGKGRLAEPETILEKATDFFNEKPLKGKKALVTCGPTYEAIDPVRFIGNRSSGKQGIAIAKALQENGAEVTLIVGPISENIPTNINRVNIESAKEMLGACTDNLPADIAIFAAAVADWTPTDTYNKKVKKQENSKPPAIQLKENPDILKTIANLDNNRPELVIGFAAETGNVIKQATEKLKRKNCDWIIANDVSIGTETFGGDFNTIHIFKNTEQSEEWPKLSKKKVAEKLTKQIITHFTNLGGK